MKATETKENLRRLFGTYERVVTDTELKGESHIPKDSLTATKEILLAAERHFASKVDEMAAVKQKDLMGDK